MNKIHIRRLTKLADLLASLPEERFDLGVWVGKDWGGKPDLSCGTTACAFGWATTIPEIAKAGLYLDPLLRLPSPALRSNRGLPAHEVAEVIFGLSPDEYEHLFLPARRYPARDHTKPRVVARRIRSLIAKHEMLSALQDDHRRARRRKQEEARR